MKTTLTVGGISAASGKMTSGVLDLGDTTIPVTVCNGAKDGPVLALVAGNHGYEYPPILALQKLRERLRPNKLAGAVIMVHVANMPSFLGRTVYFSPVDQMNLNRVYPGKRDGTVSQRIAYAITTEVIAKSDYLLDLHCGDGNESLRPYAYQMLNGDPELDARTVELTLQCRVRPYRGGSRQAQRSRKLDVLFEHSDHPRQTGGDRGGGISRRAR